ncbi:MAG: hypothetical protein ACI3ZB_05890 [Prevotella sp.]
MRCEVWGEAVALIDVLSGTSERSNERIQKTYAAGHANVCSKRAPWAKPMARMSEGEGGGGQTHPTVVDRSVLRQGSGASKFYAVGPLRGPRSSHGAGRATVMEPW